MFKKNTLRKGLFTKSLGLLMSIMLFITIATPTFAASDTGAIGSRKTYASLTRATTSASGYTQYSPNDGQATNYVSVNLTYYYTDSNGNAKKIIGSGSNTSTSIAVKVVVGTGNDVRSISASSTHRVYTSSSMWTTTLSA